MIKFFRLFIIPILCVIVFFSFSFDSFAAYGVTGDWTGNVTIVNSRSVASIIEKNDFSYSYNSDSGDITSDSYYSLYELNMPVKLELSGFTKGYIYSGRALKTGEFLVETDNINLPITFLNDFEVSIDNVNCPDGLSVDFIRLTSGNPSDFRFGISFNNFCAYHSSVVIGLTLKIRLRVYNNANSSYLSGIIVDPGDVGDTSGIVKYYSDLRDVPSNDGFIADQNQQIIDNIDLNTSAINSAGNVIVTSVDNASVSISESIKNNVNNLIGTIILQFESLNTILTDFFTPYFTNITNSFKQALRDTQKTDNTVLQGAMNDYQAAEQEVFTPAMDSLTEFDFGSNDISSLGTGFVAAITFVSSCMSNLYSLTPFSAIFDVIATLGLASILIGLSRLWFGKDG